MASRSKKPKLDPPARSMRTRSTTVPSHDGHISNPLMHKAIEARDVKAINKLLEKGETFCIGDGVNCFSLAAFRGQSISKTKPSWNVVKRMLEVEPRAISQKSKDGVTLLMVFTDCPDKIKFLVALGADINAVDKDGNSVLMRAYKNPGVNAQGFCELLKLGADPNVPHQSWHPNLIDYMLKTYDGLKTVPCRGVEQCFNYLTQPEFWLKIRKSQRSRQTVFSVIDQYPYSHYDYEHIPFRLQLSTVAISPETQLLKEVRSKIFQEDEWKYLKGLWKIPDTFLLDPLSYFYFKVHPRSTMVTNHNFSELDREITFILEKFGCVVSDSNNVVPPGLALMYNITSKFSYFYNKDFGLFGRACAELLMRNDTPRLLQEGDKILKMLVPFFSDFHSTRLVSLVVKLMQSLPHHPITIINNFVDDVSHVMVNQLARREKLLTRLKGFVQILIPVVKTRMLGRKLNGNDLERLNNVLYSDIKMDLAKEMQHPEVKVCSLVEICRWRIREELYIHRKKGQELNSCIRELCGKRLVPQTLIKMLLLEW